MPPPKPVPHPPPLQRTAVSEKEPEVEPKSALRHTQTAPARMDLKRTRWRNVRYGEGNHNTGLPTYAERDRTSAGSDTLPFGDCFVASDIAEEGHDTWLKLETGKWVLACEKDRVNCVDVTRWEDHQGRIPKSATRGQDYPVGMFTEGFSGESKISLVSASGDAFWREVNIEMLCRGIATATLFEKGWEGDDVFQDWVAYYAMNISRYSTGKRFVVTVKPTSMWRRYAGEGCCGVPLGEVQDIVGRAQWKELSWIHKVQTRINCRWGEVEFITALSFLRKYCRWSHDDCMTAANEKLMHFCRETFHTVEPRRCAAELGCTFWAWTEAFSRKKPDVEEDAIACHFLLQKLAMQTQRPQLDLRLQGSESDAWTKLLVVAKQAAPEAYDAVLREPALDCLREQRQRIESLQARVAGMQQGRPPEVADLEVKLEQYERQVKRQAERIAELEALEERLNEGQKAEQRKDAKIQELEAQIKLLQLDGGLKKQPVPEQQRPPRFVITSGNDGIAFMWSFETGMTEREFRGHESVVWSTCLSADERYLFTTSGDCTARMWSVGSGKCVRTFHHGKGAAPNWACVTPDLKYLCTAVNDCTAKIWEVESEKLIGACRHDGCVNSVCLSPDGVSLFTASDDNKGRMWQVPSGKLLRAFDGRNDLAAVEGASYQRGLYSCFVAGNGRLFFTAAFDGQTTMFDVHSGDILQTFRGAGSAKNVCASLTGDRVFIGKGSDGGSIIEMRCTESGRLLRKFVGHKRDVTAQWVSPDGLWLCSSSLDKTAKVWNINTGEVVLTFNGHKHFVQGIVAA